MSLLPWAQLVDIWRNIGQFEYRVTFLIYRLSAIEIFDEDHFEKSLFT